MSEHIHWNDKGQPLSTQFDDVYFSTQNGLEETRYVFLEHNHLHARFSALDNHATFTIAETGFGTGLNFLATCQLWQKTIKNQAHLHFISVEKFPLEKNAIQRALELWPELNVFSRELLAAYPATINGFHRVQLSHNITLTLIIDDATHGLQQLIASPTTLTLPPSVFRQWQGVDAWYLDGFTPSRNPDMWSNRLFQIMATLSQPHASFATFTAATKVRKGLINAGFSIEKKKGYGYKREMMRGVLEAIPAHNIPNDTAPTTQKKHYQYSVDPWAIIDHYTPSPTQEKIAVIGGGIAGCHSAYALAEKGYHVTIFEKENTLAAGASGNAQGVVYAKLSATQEPQGDMNVYSLLYAQQFYRHYWNSLGDSATHGQQCGVIQLSLTEKLQQSHQKIAQRFHHDENIAHYLSANEASDIANTHITSPGLFFPQAGWIDPSHLCQWLSQHDNITVVPNTTIHTLKHTGTHWSLHSTQTQTGESTDSFHTVIIATAYDALTIEQSQFLPLSNVRGQVTHYPVNSAHAPLKTAICGKGYIAPAETEYCLGASFNLGVTSTQLNADDHLTNLHNAAQQAPDLIEASILNNGAHTRLSGRAGFRCVTPDYLPVVGGVPITDDILTQFSALKKDATTTIHTAGSYHPHLYLNVGHGSRGLAYTPLCSEILASLINGCPPPIPQALLQKLSPTRFTIRDIIRS
jgi:tRNA 5-methylaminomethyl-2-thiouridine biosynthesis bifunctional protein